MYECPNGCDGQQFFQAIVQSKRVTVNDHGETIKVDAVGELSISRPRCKACGAKVQAR